MDRVRSAHHCFEVRSDACSCEGLVRRAHPMTKVGGIAMTTQIDRFVHDRMPPPEDMPQLIFELPELQFSDQLNVVVELLDRNVAKGNGNRVLLRDARE